MVIGKGFVQLAQRTGQYARINVTEVYENQFKHFNQLTEELDADFTKEGTGDVVGYVAYIELVTGFKKTVYWSKLKVNAHALKYSQAYKSGTGMTPWKDAEQFHEMAKKTVLKNTLSKWGPLSVEIENAVITDQAVIKDVENINVQYIDNEEEKLSKEEERIRLMIDDCKTENELINLRESLIIDKYVMPAEVSEYYDNKLNQLKK